MKNVTEKFLARMIHAALKARDLNAVGHSPIQVEGLVIDLKVGTAVSANRRIQGCVQFEIRSCDTSNPLHHNLVWGIWSVDENAPTFYQSDCLLQEFNLLDVECMAKLIHAMAVDYYPHGLIPYLHSAQGAAFHIADAHRAGVHAIIDAATKGVTFNDEQKTYLLTSIGAQQNGAPFDDADDAAETVEEAQPQSLGQVLYAKLVEQVIIGDADDAAFSTDEIREGLEKRYPQIVDGEYDVDALVETFTVTLFNDENFSEANRNPKLSAAIIGLFPETHAVFAAMAACTMSVDEMTEAFVSVDDLRCDLPELVYRICDLIRHLNERSTPYDVALMQAAEWADISAAMRKTINSSDYTGHSRVVSEIKRVERAVAPAPVPAKKSNPNNGTAVKVKQLGLNSMFAAFMHVHGDSRIREFVCAFEERFGKSNAQETSAQLAVEVAKIAPGKSNGQYVDNTWPEVTESILSQLPLAYVQLLGVMIAMGWGVAELRSEFAGDKELEKAIRVHQFIQKLNVVTSLVDDPSSVTLDAVEKLFDPRVKLTSVIDMFRADASQETAQPSRQRGRPITSTLPRSEAYTFFRHGSRQPSATRAVNVLDIARAAYQALDQDVSMFGHESFNAYWQELSREAAKCNIENVDVSYVREIGALYLTDVVGEVMTATEIHDMLTTMPLAAVSVFFVSRLLGTKWSALRDLTKNMETGSETSLAAIAIHTMTLVQHVYFDLHEIEHDESIDNKTALEQREAECHAELATIKTDMAESLDKEYVWMFKPTGDK